MGRGGLYKDLLYERMIVGKCRSLALLSKGFATRLVDYRKCGWAIDIVEAARSMCCEINARL